MRDRSADTPVRVTGEERLHPALRKLGRACIALVRWQRGERDETRNTPDPASEPGSVLPQDGEQGPTTTAPESGTTGAAHD